jgi:hypothetical protein
MKNSNFTEAQIQEEVKSAAKIIARHQGEGLVAIVKELSLTASFRKSSLSFSFAPESELPAIGSIQEDRYGNFSKVLVYVY